MKSLLISLLVAASIPALAKDYQVTGPIVEITATKLVVDKKGEKFEFTLSPSLKVTGGELKKGNKVTVYYSMTANEAEVKADSKKK